MSNLRRWEKIVGAKADRYFCKACGRVSEEMLEECPDGVILNIDDRDVRLPCSTWPYTREMAKVALQKKEGTDCVFAGTILVGDKTIEVTSILPAEVAEHLETVGQELRLMRVRQQQEREEKLARARMEEALRREELSNNRQLVPGLHGATLQELYGSPAQQNQNNDSFNQVAFEAERERLRQLALARGESADWARQQQEAARQQAYEWGRAYASRQAERRAAENKPEVTVQEEEETAKEEADKQKGFFKRMLEKGWF